MHATRSTLLRANSERHWAHLRADADPVKGAEGFDSVLAVEAANA